MCGIFFGEDCSFLAPLGDVFLGLMKMSIMPYIMVSLIVGIGSLSKEQAKLLLAKGGLWFVLLITISIAVILLIPLSFPTLTTASFFSKSMLQPREGVDFIRLFIPSNPFQSLVNSFIPAIVLFSIAIGVALMGLKNKQNLIQPLATLSQALTKIAKFVIKLAPLGIFGIRSFLGYSLSDEYTKDKTIDRLYNYWILGIGAEEKGHRWSIIRDVLHWVE